MDVILRLTAAGSAAIIIVLLARLFLRPAPKAFSYALWGIVLFRLLCPVGIPVELPELPDAPPVSQISDTPAQTVKAPKPSAPVQEKAAVPVIREAEPEREVYELPQKEEKQTQTASTVLLAVWGVGAVSLLLTGAISNFSFRRRLRESYPLGENIFLADHIGSAFVVGFLKPRIYLDSEIPEDQQGYILAHEKTHIRHLDHITRNLAYLALCIHWFNPLVWLAFWLSARDMEMCCDEAVVKKLGGHVRGAYSKALLTIAAGQHMIAAVAFGEGNTKIRVMNLVRWKKTGKAVTILCAILCTLVTLLCACQPAPDKDVVTSKNDGAFEKNVQETATAAASELVFKKNDTFTSTDGSVEYTWNLDQTLRAEKLPVVEVVPHIFKGDDVRYVSKYFFGEAPIYDIGVGQERKYSAEELRRKIEFMTPYLDPENLEKLDLGGDNAAMPQNVKPDFENLQRLYADAPQEIPHDLWDGTLDANTDILEDSSLTLKAFGYIGEDPYRLELQQEKESDGHYIFNRIHIYLGDGGKWDIPRYIANALMYTTEAPTEETVREVTRSAQEKLDAIDPGRWKVSRTQIHKENLEHSDQYTIIVHTAPLFYGVPALAEQQTSFYRNRYWHTHDKQYAPELSFPYADFHYNAHGRFTHFSMSNPVEEVALLNSNAQILSSEELIEKAQTQLSLYDNEAFKPMYAVKNDIPMDSLTTKAEITNVVLGMAQIPVKNKFGHFYMVPALCFEGNINYYDKNTGEWVTEYNNGGRTLVTINAIDGTIIG